jgi:SH3 domain protein
MKRLFTILILLLSVCFANQSSWGSTAYVTDSFRISLRRGPSIENKILKFLDSGAPVEIVETSEEGWSLVQSLSLGDENVRGWVLSRYLITRLPWKDQVKEMENQVAHIKERADRLDKELSDTLGREKRLMRDLEKTTKELKEMNGKYEVLKKGSAGYVEVKEAYEKTRVEMERLTKENELLKKSEQRKWVGLGAAILLIGLIIGLVMGRRQRKRSSLYS